MSVKIRLSRGGAKKRPYYYIVVANATSPRDGRYIEQIGTFDPMLKKDDPNRVKLDVERAKHWLSVGAQPTDRVLRFLDDAGLAKRTRIQQPGKGQAEEEGPGARRGEGEGRRGEGRGLIAARLTRRRCIRPPRRSRCGGRCVASVGTGSLSSSCYASRLPLGPRAPWGST